jgi:hypothetical protein
MGWFFFLIDYMKNILVREYVGMKFNSGIF